MPAGNSGLNFKRAKLVNENCIFNLSLCLVDDNWSFQNLLENQAAKR